MISNAVNFYIKATLLNKKDLEDYNLDLWSLALYYNELNRADTSGIVDEI